MWWNSRTLGEYWRLWNLPVHNWCKRHLYYPFVAYGLSPRASVMITFLVSAVLHELLIGVPTHTLRGYAFAGMVLQIPLVFLTSLVQRRLSAASSVGNVLFWVSFCVVGQPYLLVIYYYMWSKSEAAGWANR